MKKVIAAICIMLVLCGCAAQQEQASSGDISPATSTVTKNQGTIAPFTPEEREILPLPDIKVLSEDPMEFIDMLIRDYDVYHFDSFDNDFELRDVTAAAGSDGTIYTAGLSARFNTGAITLVRPVSDYFSEPKSNFAILTRFKSDAVKFLRFGYQGLTMSFYEGKYPTYDIDGDFYGIPMLEKDWNSYAYEPGEWAYAFITSTTLGQRACFMWGEDDAGDYSYYSTFNNDGSGDATGFDIQLYEYDESATISDIWLFSYEEYIQ